VIKKAHILTILLIGLVCYSSLGQGAQATMRVSVLVVSGTSVESSVNSSFSLNEQVSDLGSLVLRGKEYQNALISTSSSIELKNSEGELLIMKVDDNRRKEDDSFNVNLKGSLGSMTKRRGIFKGQLAANIEYF